MVRPVVSDADMLFGNTTRALFIFLDYENVLRVHWTPRILREMSVALVRTHRKSSMADAMDNERLMNASVTTALVDQELVVRHEAVMRAYVTDANDAHVAACAYELVTGAYYTESHSVVLTTRNLADYKIEELAKLGISVMHPDAFLLSLSLISVASAMRTWRLSLTTPPDPDRLLNRLEKDGNTGIAAALRVGARAGQFEL